MKTATQRMELREIEHSGVDYKAAVQLRDRLLRVPLGLTFAITDLAAEKADIHLAGFDTQGNLIACLVLSKTQAATTLRMRQVAVDSDAQRRGLGSQLVAYAESLAAARGYKLMTLHARQEVKNFYIQLGYTETGEPFNEVGIPHIAMQKNL
ncbi:MAG: GNAT family N-acetyltransferase [Verrucomicrobiae bacterium]|nr:GNAT family N-acetyltransferase [Verrucomicrobiae bacterium]